MTKTPDRKQLIEQRLKEVLEPTYLKITDESHLHEGHAGSRESGGGHFSIEITSPLFDGKPAIERHRMIYAALGEAMGTEIHALSISAYTREEQPSPPSSSEGS